MANKRTGTNRIPKKFARQSVALPPPLFAQVRKLADDQRLSANRVLVELIQAGIAARQREKETFMALAEELATTSSSRRRKGIKQELARLTFEE